ncbi:MAG TPA: hypothetical protein VM238_10005 [Phycisphaerae bacterium]|nr:hypothetical protein [Phycisphaerae bacterium]HUX02796.1 hypothetical protein [Phycisphaerae bacterium]
MSTLSSTSTFAQVTAAYDDNASYEEDQSTTKAAAFITACRFLLRLLPRRTSHGGRSGDETEFEPERIREEIADARAYIARNSAATSGAFGVRHPSFENFRD